jgi:hypothetical protein
VLFEIFDRHPQFARDLGDLVVLQQPQVLGDDFLRRSSFEAQHPELQPQTFLQIARRDANRIEGLHVLERALDIGDEPVTHRRDLLDGGYEIPVVVEIADDGAADLLQLFVVGLERELPEQVIRQGGGCRERVLDRRQLLDLGRRPRSVPVVEVVPEKVLVVRVVPGVSLFGGGLVGGLLLLLLLFGWLELFSWDFFEQRILDHLLVQQVRKLESRHRQQLDSLLQRRGQDELLNEFGMEFLLNRHECVGIAAPPILVQSELRAEVNPFDLLVGGEGGRGAAAKNRSVVDDISPVGNAQRFPHVVVGDEDADATVFEVKDDLLDVRDGDGIDAGERLVEQHEFRGDDQRARDFDPAALAPGQRVGRRLGQRGQAKLSQQLRPARAPGRAVERQRLENGREVLLDRQSTEDGRFLWQVPDAFSRPHVHRVVRHVGAVEEHVS